MYDGRKGEEAGMHRAQVMTLAFTLNKLGTLEGLEQKSEFMDLGSSSVCHIGNRFKGLWTGAKKPTGRLLEHTARA